MANIKDIKIYNVNDISVWNDGSCICLKTNSKYGDPVDISDDEALELVNVILSVLTEPKKLIVENGEIKII